MPDSLKSRLSLRAKARLRALFGVEPWPDLAVRHPLFRTEQYRRLRDGARAFDEPKANKPVLERGHQTSFVVARWFATAGVTSAFHVGYANGRYLFYLSQVGIRCGGTDLPEGDTTWVRIPERGLDEGTRRRLWRVDFFHLTPQELHALCEEAAEPLVGVLFSEATFETLLPWRAGGASVPSYLALGPRVLHSLMHERFPEKLRELKDYVRNMIFIEPEPAAGGAGDVFADCAKRLPGFQASVWGFRPPFDRLFRLSPYSLTKQTVYAFTRDARLLDALRDYADPL